MPDSKGILEEFARVVRPGGGVPVAQLEALFLERAFDRAVQALADARVIRDAVITGSKLYLPAKPDLGTDVQVIYAVLTVV